MTQSELNYALAAATGETLGEIRRRGFTLVDPQVVDDDPEPYKRLPETVDWDLLAEQRMALFP